MRIFPLFLLITLSSTLCAQSSKWYINAGYGAAYSFFVNSYVENQFAGEKRFLSKHPVGKNINLAIGRKLGKWELSFSYTFQEFKEHIHYDTIIPPVVFRLDHTIHHLNHIYDLSLKRQFERKTHLGRVGLGLYYLRPVQEEFTLFPLGGSTLIQLEDRNFQNSYLEEGGAVLELCYEYKFQPRVHLGIKSQFFYTITAAYAESVALYPFVKIQF